MEVGHRISILTRRHPVWWLALACLLTASDALALDPATPFRDYQLRRFGVEHGLPQISVLSVAQDSQGYLWVGTQGGVARFDGLRFVTFDRAHGGVDTTMALTVAIDPRDRVWFGTPRGAVRVEHGELKEIRANGPLLTVRAIAIDGHGQPLFATERGVLRAEGDTLVPHLLDATPTYSLLPDGDTLWVGSSGALIGLVGGASERNVLPEPSAQITHIAAVGSKLLLGTSRGAYTFEPATRRFAGPLPALGDDSVEAVLVDRSGNLWLGSTSALVRMTPDGRIERISNDILDGRPWVNALFEDRDADLWIGTRRESLYRARDGALRMRSLRDGLDDPMVWSVLADGDGVLVGSNTGLLRLDADGRFAPVKFKGKLPQQTVYELARAGLDGLWVGTRAGLARFANGALAVPSTLSTLSGKQITGVIEVDANDRWIATLDGLYRQRGDALETVIDGDGTAASRVRTLLVRSNDELWVGTEDGVRVVRGGTVTRPEWAKPFDGVFVTRLTALPDGRVVLATIDSGLGVQRGDAMLVLGAAQGLPSVSGWALDLVGDYLYVGSLDGLWRLPLAALPDPNGAMPAHIAAEIIASSGYRDSSVRGFACCNGGARSRSARVGDFLYYPSTEGVVRLDTAGVKSSPASPPAQVESITHREVLRQGDTPFKIVGGERDVSIDYTAVTFVRAYALQFRYQLQGYDADWIEAGERRTAFYTHLPPGEFHFVVQARTPNGEWGKTSSALELNIVPLWHERLVVRVIALLLLALICTMIWRARLSQLRVRAAALEAAVAERTRELARANERLRVANQTLAVENQTDPLTGLYNRRFILSNALRGGAARSSDRSAVLLLELDDFKWINDTHGFSSGDRVLVELGDVLSRSVRGGDIVARWSGVEFLLLLPGLDESGTLELAERMRVRVAAHEFRAEDDTTLRLSATIGFAHHVPEDAAGDGLEQTLDLADAALHRARRLGRNRVAGVRRFGRELPERMQPADVERLVAEGRLVWVEPGAGR